MDMLGKAVATGTPLQTAALIHRLWVIGGRSRGVARRLVEMEIGVSFRTGHLVGLMDSGLQLELITSAKAGLVSTGSALCARCGVQTTLHNWVTLGLMPFDTHRDCIVQAYREGSISLYGYLLQCNPGSGTRQSALTGGQAWYQMSHGPHSEMGEDYYAQGE
jgi:hypothetical protein